MIIINLENGLRIKRGIHGCWVLEKYTGKNNKDNDIWVHQSTCNEMKNLFIRMMDKKVVLSEENKSTLLDIQNAYDNAADIVADVVRQIDLSEQYEQTIQELEDKIKELTIQNNNLKTKFKKEEKKLVK
jgi:hypothetical protein